MSLTGDQKKNVIFINKSGSSPWKKPVIEKDTLKECHSTVSELNGNFLPTGQVPCVR